MALKKSELYSSLWQSCDALRGGMDASQYKDYVLVLLFIKYISDKYANKPYQEITIPQGASFNDMVALKGKSDIGDQINKKIVAPLVTENKQLALSDFPDFNDASKLGTGKEMVDRLTDLIAIFQGKALDFSKNRADGDDILGDAYEYLMQHFATESGKSKGQFYTPAEVSRLIANLLNIREAETQPSTTVYDPTCGSGSLLLKVADAAQSAITLYGQEKDATTSGLARMNMILHDYPTAEILQGNTLADPLFRDKNFRDERLKMFDYVVANPPFSDKRWSTGLDPSHDRWQRFEPFGVPPSKQGDYAYLLHIIRSLKETGRGACILPHGVLFRGNAEANIRRVLIEKGYIEAIVGLPVNLFYGTGIPACIIVVDKLHAKDRVATGKGIFMIDASQGFKKEGPKNSLRERDIHRITDAFKRRLDVYRFARQVPLAEIKKNDFNLNLPRYIDSQIPEEQQDLEGHLKGGIPEADIHSPGSMMAPYWAVCPKLKRTLFKKKRPGYFDLAIDKTAIKSTIYSHPEFSAFIEKMNSYFIEWRVDATKTLKDKINIGCRPKEIIVNLSEGLLNHYINRPLIDPYAIYQHLMDYWAETMQDDCYLIAAEGWQAKPNDLIEKNKQEKRKHAEKNKGWVCDLIPKTLIVARYFAKKQAALEALQLELETIMAQRFELEETHSGEEAVFFGFDKINAASVKESLRELKNDSQANADDIAEETQILQNWLEFDLQEKNFKRQIKETELALDHLAYQHYASLSETEIKLLVIDDKWMACLDAAFHSEMDRVSQQLAKRVKELAERYETPLWELNELIKEAECVFNDHLVTMDLSL